MSDNIRAGLAVVFVLVLVFVFAYYIPFKIDCKSMEYMPIGSLPARCLDSFNDNK